MRRTHVISLVCAAAGINLYAAGFDLTVLHTNSTGVFAVGDINGDGTGDIVASRSSDNALVWYEYPSHSEHTIDGDAGEAGGEIHTADVDRDGDADVMFPDGTVSKVVWYENPGHGTVSAAGAWTSHDASAWTGSGWAHDFKIGDFNGDGKVDAVVCRNNDGTPWHVMIQSSPILWTTVDIPGPHANGKEGTWVADIDGDGRDDITDGVKWVKAPEDPTDAGAWTEYVIGSFACGNRRACIADLNDDGNRDILVAVAEFQKCNFTWYEAPADPTVTPWTEHIIISEVADWNFHTLQAGDVDLDGDIDIVVGTTHGPNTYPKLMKILYNENGDGLTWHDTTWTTRYGVWQGVLADVGSDGDLDILTADYDGGAQLEFWENGLRDGTNRSISSAAQPACDTRRQRTAVSCYDIRGRLISGGTKDNRLPVFRTRGPVILQTGTKATVWIE